MNPPESHAPKPQLSTRAQRELWTPYRAAELGLRNYWYPVCFATDLADKRPKPLQVLGERLLLRRVGAEIYAVEDRCAHRRVALSHRERVGAGPIECLTEDTVTCWYHGFTYSFRTGQLVTNISWPSCPLVGELSIKTYPVREAQGLVYVWIGDEEAGELENDLAPGFLDEHLAVAGRMRVVQANWRWGVENGFDSTHVFLHRNSILFGETKTFLPLALVPKNLTGTGANLIVDSHRAGIREDLATAYDPVFAAEVGSPGGEHVQLAVNPKEGFAPAVPEISIWLPGMLSVRNFPIAGLTVFEHYVPIDERSHYYFQLLGKRCTSEHERTTFTAEVHTRWESILMDGFNGDDVIAREAMQDAYTRGGGWLEETLTAQDLCISEWRTLVCRHARGIAKRGEQA
jgi:carbazole 1,9a-dioxygenase terminal dioxygenase component